jgi:hypothetical protein
MPHTAPVTQIQRGLASGRAQRGIEKSEILSGRTEAERDLAADLMGQILLIEFG